MNSILREILDWAEVWPLLIPLPFIIKNKSLPKYLKPIKAYVWIALIINILATCIWKRNKLGLTELPEFFHSNNFLYNIHSIIRLLLFSYFFILLGQRFMHRVKKALPFLFLLLAAVNFIFFENFFDRMMFSNRLLAMEAAILLFYCLQYYIYLTIEDRSTALVKQPGFWIVTGLSFFVAASFFIFLFYSYLTAEDLKFAVDIWDVHNIAYVLLCICIAINFKKQND